jgi:hypothetical protein
MSTSLANLSQAFDTIPNEYRFSAVAASVCPPKCFPEFISLKCSSNQNTLKNHRQPPWGEIVSSEAPGVESEVSLPITDYSRARTKRASRESPSEHSEGVNMFRRWFVKTRYKAR